MRPVRWLNAFLVFSLLVPSVCLAQDNDGEKVFRKRIADPIPVGITITKEAQSRWMDDISYVEFVADEAAFKALLQDYQPLDPGTGKYALPTYAPKEFKESGIEYFRKVTDREGDDSKFRDKYYLARNPANNHVYFYFPGSTRYPKDKPMPPVSDEL